MVGQDQRSNGYRSVHEPFDHPAFLAAVAAAWGGIVDRTTHQMAHIPIISLEQLAFVVDAVRIYPYFKPWS